MFTGVYPSTHNTIQSFSVLPTTLPTLAERLHDGGYFLASTTSTSDVQDGIELHQTQMKLTQWQSFIAARYPGIAWPIDPGRTSSDG